MVEAVAGVLEQHVLRLLRTRGKEYLTVRQLLHSLGAHARQQLRLPARPSTTDVLKRLTPLLGDSLQVYESPPAVYIGYKRSPTELVVSRIQQHPGISPKQLGMRLPLSRRCYLDTLNALLGAGTLVCTFKENHVPMLHIAARAGRASEAEDERATLRAAYIRVGQGRSFVRIHRLRAAIPWLRERFDRVLQMLIADYTVELHGGDPSVLSQDELQQSWTDADGTLYIALSWRGQT